MRDQFAGRPEIDGGHLLAAAGTYLPDVPRRSAFNNVRTVHLDESKDDGGRVERCRGGQRSESRVLARCWAIH